jgi:hypothetical protein
MIHNRFLYAAFCVLVGLFLVSCEEAITIDVGKGKSELAVDAMITVEDGLQELRLMLTSGYFDNANPATAVTDARVLLVNINTLDTFLFQHRPDKPGYYRSNRQITGNTGNIFGLFVEYNGDTLNGFSRLSRPTHIDSLYQEERPAEFGNEAGKYLYLLARDSAGAGDCCWIRYTLNGKENLQYNRLNQSLPIDAAFNPGAADGLEFIYPVRNSINTDKSYVVGDTLGVMLYSIDPEHWRFLKEMDIQLNNQGLFANPQANVRGNMFNFNAAKKTGAQGCFGICRVSKAGVRIK